MQGHRFLRGVAVLILVVALVYLAAAIGGAFLLSSRGFGAGWGTGSTAWVVIPLAAAAILSGLTLLVFGLMLFFLARIDNNLEAVKRQRVLRAVPPEAPVVAAPLAAAAPVFVAPEERVLAPAVEAPEIVVPEIEAPAAPVFVAP